MRCTKRMVKTEDDYFKMAISRTSKLLLSACAVSAYRVSIVIIGLRPFS